MLLLEISDWCDHLTEGFHGWKKCSTKTYDCKDAVSSLSPCAGLEETVAMFRAQVVIHIRGSSEYAS